MIYLKNELELLRKGDISIFVDIISRLKKQYSPKTKAELIQYAACELAQLNVDEFNDENIQLIFFLGQTMFDSEYIVI